MSVSTDSESIQEEEEDEYETHVFDCLTEDECIDMDIEVYQYIDDYFTSNQVSILANEKYKEFIANEVSIMIYNAFIGLCSQDTTPRRIHVDDDIAFFQIEEFVVERIHIYMTCILEIPRSIKPGDESNYHRQEMSSNVINEKIHMLENAYQPQQRTIEWYQVRYNLLTATNIGQLLSSDSDANLNRVIYEKCKPLETTFLGNSSSNEIKIDSPMHWGQKYEPVTLAIYEKKYNTKVGDFGCLVHSNTQYSCIGASPDGINNDITNTERFGRMVEIKNVVSREITGIPVTKYWIQTQIQMEVCDLEECDFVETKFKENPFFQNIFNEIEEEKERRIVLYFTKASNCTFIGRQMDEIIATSLEPVESSYGPTPQYVYICPLIYP